MKWPSLAAHSRASLADALGTVTPVLTRPDARDRPDPRELRRVLYQHAFNSARLAEPGSAAAQTLSWAQQASLPIGCPPAHRQVIKSTHDHGWFPGQGGCILNPKSMTSPSVTVGG